MGNSLHVLGVVHHGLITWSLIRSFLVEFTKYLPVVHALVSVLVTPQPNFITKLCVSVVNYYF